MDSKTTHISEGAVALEELDACDSLEGVAEYGDSDAPGAGGGNVPAGSLGASTAPRKAKQDLDGAGSRERLWSPLFVIVVAGTLCCFMVGQGLNSGTSVFIARMGGSTAFAGVLAAVFSAAAAAARIVCGPLVDRAGRLRVMVGGAALLLAGTLVPAICSNDAVFVVCRIVQGVGFSAATTASATAAADVLPLSRLGEGIGYYGLGQALAMSVGPALALFLVNTDPAANLYLGLAVIAALGLVLAALCRYERNPSRLPATAAYRRLHEERRELELDDARGDHGGAEPCAARVTDKPQACGPAPEPSARGLGRFFELSALPGALPMVVLSPAFGFGIFFVGLYGTSLGVVNPGLFYTLSALSMIAVRLKSKSFMDRVAPIKICTASTACGFGGFLLLFLAGSSDLAYYAAGILYGVCLGVSMPLNQSVAVKNTPAERWGAANALYLLASDVGIGVSSIVWGLVNDAAGFPATICCVMGCILAAWVVAWFSYPSTRRERKKA